MSLLHFFYVLWNRFTDDYAEILTYYNWKHNLNGHHLLYSSKYKKNVIFPILKKEQYRIYVVFTFRLVNLMFRLQKTYKWADLNAGLENPFLQGEGRCVVSSFVYQQNTLKQ